MAARAILECEYAAAVTLSVFAFYGRRIIIKPMLGLQRKGHSEALVTLGFAVIAALLVWLGYGHAIDAGFFLDDNRSIVRSTIMSNPDPSGILRRYPGREVGYFTFWLNYQYAGQDAAAFRAVNLVIHWAAGLLVFLLTRRLLSLASDKDDPTPILLGAGFAGLLFLLHPLQIGAVTYIVQRLASLTAVFYLLALISWLEFRLKGKTWPSRALFFLLFGVSCTLALNTKQNAVTLLPVIVFLELFILRSFKVTVLRALSFVALLGFAAILVWVVSPDWLLKLDAMTRETNSMTRWEYFSHQWVVLWIYLSKVVWPAPLMLEYGITAGDFSPFARAFAGLCHLSIIVAALYYWRRAPLITFGVAFFYSAHAVESGVFPIRDLAFEHRNYLPMAGICIALGAVVTFLARRLTSWGLQLTAGATLVLSVFTWATYERNALWANQEAFLKHDVKFSNQAPRALNNLASWYQNEARYPESIEIMRQLLQRSDNQLTEPQVVLYLSILINVGLYDDAIEIADQLLDFTSNRYNRGQILRLMGIAFTGMADDQAAVDAFEEAMMTIQLDYESGLAYGYSLVQLGRVEDAFVLIKSHKERFGERPKLTMLARNADLALQRQRSQQRAAGEP